MTSAVLDASALIALLRDEPGSEQVAAMLEDAAMTTVNIAEVVGHYARAGADATAIEDMLSPLPVELIGFDETLAYQAGLMLPATKAAGLSLADRACLALARQLGVPALTADRAWPAVAARLDVMVQLIRHQAAPTTEPNRSTRVGPVRRRR
ncbi:MAG: type II toxin-antitoxin system VapC family toxin [Nevskiales bacterium]